MLSAQTATGNPSAGTPFLMLTFAAVALGGTPLSGGRGSLVGSILGAGTLMLLQKVLFSGGVSSFYTGIFQGLVLLLAIVFGNVVARLNAHKDVAMSFDASSDQRGRQKLDREVVSSCGLLACNHWNSPDSDC
nr:MULTISPECIES: hypothetical protein [unclassified Mesorhizobium]